MEGCVVVDGGGVVVGDSMRHGETEEEGEAEEGKRGRMSGSWEEGRGRDATKEGGESSHRSEEGDCESLELEEGELA